MKKFIKLFALLLIAAFVLPLTGCKEARPTYETKDIPVDFVVIGEVKEGYTFVGYLQEDLENKQSVLYRPGASIPAGKYDIIFVENSKVKGGNYSLPEVLSSEGLTFAGWYTNAEYQNQSRVATVSQLDKINVVYARYLSLADAGLVALVCILIVFAMLALLWFIVSMFKYIAPKEGAKKVEAPVASQPVAVAQPAFTAADIKDEDMMVAALVASIDYREETKENVRVVSVKQIG